MNERIKKLARQAGFHNNAIIDLGTGTGVEVWHRYDIENDQEDFPTDEMMTKFAELIVQDAVLSEREECAKVADRQNGDDEEDSESCVWSKAARHIAAAIRARGSK